MLPWSWAAVSINEHVTDSLFCRFLKDNSTDLSSIEERGECRIPRKTEKQLLWTTDMNEQLGLLRYMRIYVLKRSLKDRTLHKGQFKWENELPKKKKKTRWNSFPVRDYDHQDWPKPSIVSMNLVIRNIGWNWLGSACGSWMTGYQVHLALGNWKNDLILIK